jgi:hypothetical protein
MGPGQLDSLARNAGVSRDLRGDQVLEPRVDLDEIRDDERRARPIWAFGDECAGVKTVVHAGRTVHPDLETLELHPERRRDVS